MIKKFIQKQKDGAMKMFAPKIVTGFINILRLGPRMIFRHAMQLLRANFITRVLSCATLLFIDIYDLAKKRVSKAQFTKNVIISALIILSGTAGWGLGSRYIVFNVFGRYAEIAGGFIGASAMSYLLNFILNIISGKLFETDAEKMWKILDPHIFALPADERKEIHNNITGASLKRMFASENKEEYAAELIGRLQKGEKAGS